MTLLEAMVNTAMSLNEPGEMNSEYARGQAELIVDSCGMVMDLHRDLVLSVITHLIRPGDFYDELTELACGSRK